MIISYKWGDVILCFEQEKNEKDSKGMKIEYRWYWRYFNVEHSLLLNIDRS